MQREGSDNRIDAQHGEFKSLPLQAEQPNIIGREVQVDRSNTNFATELRKLWSNVKYENGILHDYQQVVVKYVRYVRVKYGSRGLLVAFDPGVGKTRVAVALAKEFTKGGGRMRKIYMISEKSLHDNYRSNLDKYPGKGGVETQYYSLNASNFGEKLNEIDFEDSVVIVDEAHKFATMVVNGSIAGRRMYMGLRDTKNVIVLFLTGTPIMNTAFEVVVYFNILAGFALFPENRFEFDKFFGDGRNMPLYQNRIMGLSSFVHAAKNSADYPTELPVEEIYLPMSTSVYAQYVLESDHEAQENARNLLRAREHGGVAPRGAFQATDSGSSTYRVKTRQLCNGTWKREWIMQQILGAPTEKIAVYSQFIGDGGLGPLRADLDATGLYYDVSADESQRTPGATRGYIVMTSEHETEERTELQSKANASDNINGQKIQVILVSGASTFGLRFAGVRRAIVMEPYWLLERLFQFFHRFIYYKSHDMLPPDQRTIRSIVLLTTLDEAWKASASYVAPSIQKRAEIVDQQAEINNTEGEVVEPVLNKMEKARRGPESGPISSDIDIYEKSQATKARNNVILKATEATSIERMLGLIPGGYVCAPNNQTIFSRDFYSDMQKPNFCDLNYGEKIKARQVMYEGDAYYYTTRDNIFRYDAKVDGYVELAHNTNIYKQVRAAI